MIIDRRRFLSGMGLSASALAVGGLSHRAWGGGEGGAPKRLIILSTGHGTVYDGWKMRPAAQPDAKSWAFDFNGLDSSQFSRGLEPLHAARNRMIVLDGLSMVSAERDLAGYRHEKGWVHAWTGGQALLTGADIFSTQPSIDQLVAAQIGRVDRLPSLELTIGEGRPICHAGFAQQLPLENDPARVFDRLFGLATSKDPLIGAQGSVLDFAIREFDAASPKLSALDAERMTTHFDLLRQLEQRIVGMSEATCSSSLDRASLASTSAGYQELFLSMAELIASAFSCDLTRVATISLGDLPASDFGWGNQSGDVHNDFAHQIYVNEQAAAAMTDYQRYHASQVAALISLLESIPDSDGRSLMDNTLIVWSCEMADGWHGYEKHFAATFGGDWYFRPGQYLHWPYETSSDFSVATPAGMSSGAGMPHQHLLVSVARAMGLDTDVVGMAELANRSGQLYSLAGELPEMRL